MRSNRLSAYLGFTTFGESHGPALGVVIEDIKPGIDFPYEELNQLLAQRKPNSSPYSTSRNETDEYQVISGIFEGKTTGMPICILFWNKDADSAAYDYLKDVFRPGHADYSWFQKFKLYDYRGGGRASGRETISRVAASAFVRELLQSVKISFKTIQIGILANEENNRFHALDCANPFCWTDHDNISLLYSYLDNVKANNDTVGGLVRVRIDNVPAGLGDPVFAKLNANLAQAVMSIGTVKGISFGDGFEIAGMKGNEANDQMNKAGFLSNHAGGIQGGISNGQPIILNIAVKAISSHGKPQQTITHKGEETTITIKGRHDVCHIPRLLPVIEAMIKLALADAISWQKQIAGNELDMTDYREALDKIDEDLLLLLYRRKQIVQQVKQYKEQHQLEFRDIAREEQMQQEWKKLAEELGLSTLTVSDILEKVLEVCRYDNPDHSL
jgi:chorismate synthase